MTEDLLRNLAEDRSLEAILRLGWARLWSAASCASISEQLMAALVASLTRVWGGMAATLGTLFMCNTEERVWWWWGGRTLDRRGGMTKAAMERGKGES